MLEALNVEGFTPVMAAFEPVARPWAVDVVTVVREPSPLIDEIATALLSSMDPVFEVVLGSR